MPSSMDKMGALFTSNTNEWATPDDFFMELDSEFHFDLDPCATESNAKCKDFYTIETDGLTQNWGGEEFSVTLLMAARYGNGSRRATTNLRSPELWS